MHHGRNIHARLRQDKRTANLKAAISLASASIAFAAIAAWITHVVWVIRQLSEDVDAVLMIFGGIAAVIPPIGIVHGVMIWFGAGM